MVSYIAIEAQVVFETLLALVTGQLAIAGQLESLEERFIHRELGYFLGVGDRDNLEEEFLVDKVTGNGFALFWEAMAGPEVEAFSCS